MNIRIGTLDDIQEIMELVSSSIETMESHGIDQWDNLYPTKEDFEDDIKRNQLFVATINHSIACIFTVNQDMDEAYNQVSWNRDSFIVIHRLCVHPTFQNKGVAREIMQFIIHNMRVSSIRLDVFSQNPYALKLYQSLGFVYKGDASWRKGKFYLMEYVKEGK